jgi:glycosyltransferase involved in cell wall biosynthesis
MSGDSRTHVVFWRKVTRNTTWGGGEFRLLSYAKALDATRYRVTIIATHDIFSDTFAREGLDVNVVCTGDVGTSGRVDGLVQIVTLLWTLSPDLLVVIQGSFTDVDVFQMAAMLIGVRMRRTKLVELQISSPETGIRVSRRAWLGGRIPVGRLAARLRKALFTLRGVIPARVVAVSHGAKERMVDWFGYSATKTLVIHHGIPLDRFHPDRAARARMRAVLGIPDDAMLIVSTARFTAEKHPEWIVDAIDRLGADARLRWLFVGDGPMRPAIEERVRQLGASARVSFAGHVSETCDYLRAADIFVLSSSREGLSNAMLEAMATGLVAVVTCVAGAEDAIADGQHGILTAVTSAGVTASIERALALSEADRRRMGMAAIGRVVGQFNRRTGVANMLATLGLH